MTELERVEEIWKPVKGWEKLFEVSNHGRVRRIDTGQLVSIRINYKTGYSQVSLSHPSVKMVTKNVHRLVAETFIENPYNKPQVNHINEDKQDNYVENLEWVTASENNRHATKIERQVKTSRDNHSYEKMLHSRANNGGAFAMQKIKLTIKDSGEIKVFASLSEAEKYSKINRGSIQYYLKGKAKKNGVGNAQGNYLWEYANE